MQVKDFLDEMEPVTWKCPLLCNAASKVKSLQSNHQLLTENLQREVHQLIIHHLNCKLQK